MSERGGFTVLHVHEDLPVIGQWNNANLGLIGVAALTFFCTLAVAPALQLWANPTTRISTLPNVLVKSVPKAADFQFSAKTFADEPSQGALGLQSVPTSASLPTSHWTAAFGTLVVFMGAAVALVHKVFTPKAETLALLPMTGMTSALENFDDGMSEIFTFENLRSAPGSRHRKKRKGRGHAAGQGATCGFGTRGQKSRKGRSVRPGFEGGQNPLWRRTPKLRGRPLGPGHKRIVYQMVSILKLGSAVEGSTIQFDDLSGGKPVLFKVGGVKKDESVSIPSNLTVKAHAFTGTAKSAIEAAGGKCIVIDKYSREVDAEGKVAEKVAMIAYTGEVAYYKDSDFDDESVEGEVMSDDDMLSDCNGEEIALFAATAVRTAKVGKYKEPTPLTHTISPAKKDIVADVHNRLKDSFLVFGFTADGYTHAQLTKIRTTMPDGVKVQIVKNTLFRMASRGTGFEALDPLTMGSKAWVFVPESCFQEAIKVYGAFLKENKKQDTNPIVGGATEGQLLTEQQVIALSELPTKKELIEKLARLVKGIQTRVASSVKAVPRKLAVAIKLATVGDEDKEGNKDAAPAEA